MAYGFAFIVIAFGASLFYKGYKGWDWPTFYRSVFGVGAAAAPSSAGATGPAQTKKQTTKGG